MAINNPNDSLKAELAAKTGSATPAETPAAIPTAAQTNPMSTPAVAAISTPATSAPATPAAATPSNPYDYQNRIDTINQMFDSAINRTRADLDTAYEQNRRDLEANREDIARTYQNQRNVNAADYERARRNFNQQALANGLNTGAGSQAALAQNAVYSRNQGALSASQASANVELDRTLADLKIQYQNNINAAIAENDYNRAATLLDEYNNQYNMALNNAQLLSQYGDFSGFANLFGQETADQMRQMWMYQNPGIAYSMGQITADEYHNLTGSYPPGYGGGYYYGGGGGGGGGDSGGGTTDGAGVTVDPATGIEYINDGAGLVPLVPDGVGTPETEASANTNPNAFAGARGGPTFDSDIDPRMAGNRLDQTIRLESRNTNKPEAEHIAFDPQLVARATDSPIQALNAEPNNLRSRLTALQNTTGMNLNPDSFLISNMSENDRMQTLRERYPDANPVMLRTLSDNYADMADADRTALAGYQAREANKQALRDRFFSSTFGNPVLAQNMADNQAQAAESADRIRSMYQASQAKNLTQSNGNTISRPGSRGHQKQTSTTPVRLLGNADEILRMYQLIMGPNFRFPMATNMSR